MRMLVAQEFQRMRREIDDDQPAARPQQARRLADRHAGFVEIVQHLVHGHEIEGIALDRRRIDVALPHLRMRTRRPCRDWRAPRPASRATCRCRRRADRAARTVRAAGPCRCRDRAWPGRDGLPTSDSSAASTAWSGTCSERSSSQLAALALKYWFARSCRRRLTAAEPLHVALDLRVAHRNSGDHALHEVASRVVVGDAEERPRALLVALHQPGLHQQLEMARDARLRLVEDVGKVGNGQVAARNEHQDAQAAGFGRRLQYINHQVEAGAHERPFSRKHINISLCEDFAVVQRLCRAQARKCRMIASGIGRHVRDARRRGGTGIRSGRDGRATPSVVFIGTIRSPWTSRAECPKNMGAARERARAATVEIDRALPPWPARAARAHPRHPAHLAPPCAAESDCAETAPCQ